MGLVYMQSVHGWLSAYERLVNSQKFFSPYLTQEDMSRLGRDYLQVGYAAWLDFFRSIIPVCAEPYGQCAMTSFQVRRTGPL